MDDPNFSWIYIIIFLAIPLARIIPRILAKRGIGKSTFQPTQEKQFQPSFEEYNKKPQTEAFESQMESSKPQTKKRLVLGEIINGSRTFEKIQKNTGFENKELDATLEKLEKDGMLKVHQKQGLMGQKIELHPTDKGIKEYYS